jgi:hypothetical protein
MQSKTAPLVKYGWIVPLAVLLFIVVGAYLFEHASRLTPSDWAAWIQAIGSVGAIAAAVWVFHRQYAANRENGEAEVRAFVQAINDELRTIWTGAIKFEVQHLPRVRCAHAKKKNVSTASA